MSAAIPAAPLFGREFETQRLVDRVRERGGAVVVRGEVGIGKSALTDAAAAPDLFLIALVALNLLGEAATQFPVLLIVEDAAVRALFEPEPPRRGAVNGLALRGIRSSVERAADQDERAGAQQTSDDQQRGPEA